MELSSVVFHQGVIMISGYNTMQAIKVLPKFMPTARQADVRLMVSFIIRITSTTFGSDRNRLSGSEQTMLASREVTSMSP